VKAVRKRLAYCGNIVLGNSMNVERGTNIVDCLDVYGAEQVAYSKGIGFSCEGTWSESMFGCNGFGYSSFIICGRGIYKSSRCLEITRSDNCSDCYFSHGLSNCQDCIFCFNLKNHRHCIGNCQLTSDEYADAKERLVGEMRKELLEKGRLPVLSDLIGAEKPDYAALKNVLSALGGLPSGDKGGTSAVERAFSIAMQLVLCKPHGGLDGYSGWLLRAIPASHWSESCASKQPLLVPGYANYAEFPHDRLLTRYEVDALGGLLSIDKGQAQKISMGNAGKALSPIAYFSPEWHVGKEMNVVESPLNIDSVDCYKTTLAIESKGCAISYIPRNSEGVFGSYYSRQSSFVLCCSQSTKLRRCFECDSCRDCSDCYFCHNCENVRDSIFCFNAKNLKYAIGNAEMPREEYMEVKKRVLAEINAELESKKTLKWDIFSIGAAAE
jgi:hypothetical protein